jgi:hypothetical protein
MHILHYIVALNYKERAGFKRIKNKKTPTNILKNICLKRIHQRHPNTKLKKDCLRPPGIHDRLYSRPNQQEWS